MTFLCFQISFLIICMRCARTVSQAFVRLLTPFFSPLFSPPWLERYVQFLLVALLSLLVVPPMSFQSFHLRPTLLGMQERKARPVWWRQGGRWASSRAVFREETWKHGSLSGLHKRAFWALEYSLYHSQHTQGLVWWFGTLSFTKSDLRQNI